MARGPPQKPAPVEPAAVTIISSAIVAIFDMKENGQARLGRTAGYRFYAPVTHFNLKETHHEDLRNL